MLPPVTLLLQAVVAQQPAIDIITPSPAQLRYQSTDFIALIHFNMGTFAHNGDPCCDASNWDVLAPYAAGKTSDPATFNPKLLNTTQWMESITGLGANIAILTAKHVLGAAIKLRRPASNGGPSGHLGHFIRVLEPWVRG